MTVLTWVLRLIIFAFLLVFAALNTDPVSLRFLPGQVVQLPLVIGLLAFFLAGTVLGALSLLGVILRQRREIARLKKAGTKESGSSVVSAEMPPVV